MDAKHKSSERGASIGMRVRDSARPSHGTLCTDVRLISAALLLAGLAPAAAFAQTNSTADDSIRLSVSESQRPLTPPRLVLEPELGFQIDTRPTNVRFGELDVSLSLGITDDLSVHALVAPLQLWGPGASGFQYGESNRNFGPGAGLTYRVLRGTTELAIALSGRIYTIPELSGGAVIGEIPLRVHLSERLRLDVSAVATVQLASAKVPINSVGTGNAIPSLSASSNALRLNFPVRLLGNITRSFAIAANTGLTIYDASDVRNTLGIPLGLAVSYSIPGPHGPLLDIDPFFNFPYLFLPARASGSIQTAQYQIGVGLTGFFYL